MQRGTLYQVTLKWAKALLSWLSANFAGDLDTEIAFWSLSDGQSLILKRLQTAASSYKAQGWLVDSSVRSGICWIALQIVTALF